MGHNNILDEIFAHKRLEVEHSRQIVPFDVLDRELQRVAPPLDFLVAMRSPGVDLDPSGHPALIAEVKHKSPSRGLLAGDFDPLSLACTYQENGAAAISVLTDERYFGGSLEHLRQIAGRPSRLPLLRKDFTYDPYQVYEARAAGADALLLIIAGLNQRALRQLHDLACELGMVPLVEVHSLDELKLALDLNPALIGINNRNLQDFSVRLETTIELRPHIPPEIRVVAESGIRDQADIQRLSAAGVDAILVGEALVSAPDVGAKVRELCGRGNKVYASL
jgi:indole-3-glycerol phosphate synthase